MSWLLSLTLFRNFSGETVNVAYIMKTLAKSQPIYRPKSPRSPSKDWFLYRMVPWYTVHTPASVQDFKRWQSHKDDRPPALFVRFCPSGLFSQSQSEELTGISLSQDSFKTSCDEVV
jgi:hypothetical protein